MYKKSIMLFRKDLRLDDNTALINATKMSQEVCPLFIMDPRQVGDENTYKSDNAIDFMVTSLLELEAECHTYGGVFSCAYDESEKYIEKILKTKTIGALFLNKDYTPFSIKRDAAIEALCKKYDVAYHTYDDGVLCVPGAVLTGSHTPYTIFTPFFKKASLQEVTKINSFKSFSFAKKHLSDTRSVTDIVKKIEYTKNKNKYVVGGFTEAKEILAQLDTFKKYETTRNFPELPTTYLAAHIKFGTVSIRAVYHAVLKQTHNMTLLKQLYWRDFFIHLGYFFPHVFKTAFHKKYAHIEWKMNKEYFKAWCEGKTGFPIVDAGMRQLNKTGYMHNRVRMIVAFLLTKNLHIDWKDGERYFAQKLVDYDPAVNNGSWQWCASTGADAQPYFRVFNPWLQQKKFDPECEYIKKWVPELKNVPAQDIHAYYKSKNLLVKSYPLPIVDHTTTSTYIKTLFKNT